MSEPTRPWRSAPRPAADAGTESDPSAEPVPPHQPTWRPPVVPSTGSATEPVLDPPAPRRRRLRTGAAAAGLLGVGLVAGVIVGQATAGSASAGTTPAPTQIVPGTQGSRPFGPPPDGGRGGFTPGGPDSTDDGATGDSTT